ncbi:WW domain-containing protein wwm1 [Aspergillus brasiliensis]|uniref:WW domain-containing protein wwm1 n=1 Tax=Aspergillus brasiliensis TaxID=319629 RepID=A0A9W5YST3_9EURO|nr:WW domain-containing protein wwm1 [Aspergillus brasiliensis]GKZ44504.1 WW domain-containing protein wwm1 [Aspergillus brasiliensis]
MPPSPTPSVPEGWKAEFDNRYQEWYYVNIHTRQPHWERPSRPASPDGAVPPPNGPPPNREATTRVRPVGQGDADPQDHDLPEVYIPQPQPSQPAHAPNPEQGYYGYPQPQYSSYAGYNYNPAYPPPAAYPNRYPNVYQSPYDQIPQPPHNPKEKKGLKKMVAAVLALGGGLVSGTLLGASI